MINTYELSGRVAVITGGASGIGRGIAERFVAHGAQVVIADIEDAPLAATAAEIGAVAIRTDVTRAADVEKLAAAVLDRFGRVDIVCNNAGVGPLRPFDELSVEDFQWVMSINLFGVLHGIKAFLPHLKGNPDGGWIVNTASMAGLIAGPGLAAYSASKYAIVAVSEVLAQELADTSVGVKVLVPAQVRSNIGTSERNRTGVDPASLRGDANDPFLPPTRVLEADYVGELVIRALADPDLYIVTHPETLPQVQGRFAAISAAFNNAAAKGV